VVEDQCHPSPVPDLALPTHLTYSLLESLVEQSSLQMTPAVTRLAHKDLLERLERTS